MNKRTLNAFTILVTRPREQAESFVRQLEERGAACEIVPLIRIEPPASYNDCDDALARLREYNGIICTSVNAVTQLVARMNEAQKKIAQQLPTFVVGCETYEAAASAGLRPMPPPAVHDAVHLANEMAERGVAGKKFLLPQGNRVRGELKQMLLSRGAQVDDVVVYRTVGAAEADADRVQHLMKNNPPDVVAFFSPSAVGQFAALVPAPIPSACAVIGKTTADAVERAGFVVDIVADPSTAEGLVASIEMFLAHRVLERDR